MVVKLLAVDPVQRQISHSRKFEPAARSDRKRSVLDPGEVFRHERVAMHHHDDAISILEIPLLQPLTKQPSFVGAMLRFRRLGLRLDLRPRLELSSRRR